MNQKNLVSRISSPDLARRLMGYLWINYDHGGISLRRSLRAYLLEVAMDLMPVDFLKKYKVSRDDIGIDSTFQEVEVRKHKLQRRFVAKVRNFDLKRMSDRCLISLILCELNKIYENDKRNLLSKPFDTSDFCYSKHLHDVVHAIMLFLSCEQYIKQCSGVSYAPMQLINEAESRATKRSQVEEDKRFKHLWGSANH